MFRSLFTRFTRAGSDFERRAARQAITRASRLGTITLLMLGSLSSAAMAQVGIFDGGLTAQPAASIDTPLRAFFTKLTCTDESNDNTWPNPDHDEPYLLICAIDLRPFVPETKVFISPVYSDVDTGDTINDQVQFWPPTGSSRSIGSDNDCIFLVALLESDDVLNAGYIKEAVEDVLLTQAYIYKATYRLPRADMVGLLRQNMHTTIEQANGAYGIRYGIDDVDRDDRVGGVFELIWGTDWLPVARSGQTVARSARLIGPDSSYNLEFQLRR
jgi:hypothetical protein